MWMNLPSNLVEAMEKKKIASVKLIVDDSQKKLEKLEAKRERKRKIAIAQAKGIDATYSEPIEAP